jgi:hypothetical protein
MHKCTKQKHGDKKMKASELMEKLFSDIRLYTNEMKAATQVLCAYSDSHKELDEPRDLDFFCNHPVEGETAIMIADRCIGGYNEFNKDKMELIVDIFGEESLYYFARESSVCIYIKTVKNVWISDKIMKITRADEFSFDSRLNMFRLWWD